MLLCVKTKIFYSEGH